MSDAKPHKKDQKTMERWEGIDNDRSARESADIFAWLEDNPDKEYDQHPDWALIDQLHMGTGDAVDLEFRYYKIGRRCLNKIRSNEPHDWADAITMATSALADLIVDGQVAQGRYVEVCRIVTIKGFAHWRRGELREAAVEGRRARNLLVEARKLGYPVGVELSYAAAMCSVELIDCDEYEDLDVDMPTDDDLTSKFDQTMVLD